MQKNIFRIILPILLLIGYESIAQVNTSSPYSRFGIGEIENNSMGRANAMGGISVGLSLPFEINIINPASYSAIPAQLFLFQVGVRSRQTIFESQNQGSKSFDNGLVSLNAAFRVTKFWAMSFGVNPVSSIGYEIFSSDSAFSDDYNAGIETDYFGEGGLNQLYLGNAFFYKGLSVGVNASYIFGPMTQRSESLLSDNSYSSYFLDLQYTNVSDFYFRYGMQYTDSVLGKYKYTVGAFYENNKNLKTEVTRFSMNTIVNGANTIYDTIYNDLLYNGFVGMPKSFGAGISVMSDKFLVGFDYKQQNWSQAEFLGSSEGYISNSNYIAGGIEYTHDYLAKNYFKRMSYRIGGHLSDTYVKINGTQIVDKSLSFGFGLPTKSGSKVNVGFEIGEKGTLDNNLVKENYYILNVNLSLIDRWFVKRRFE